MDGGAGIVDVKGATTTLSGTIQVEVTGGTTGPAIVGGSTVTVKGTSINLEPGTGGVTGGGLAKASDLNGLAKVIDLKGLAKEGDLALLEKLIRPGSQAALAPNLSRILREPRGARRVPGCLGLAVD